MLGLSTWNSTPATRNEASEQNLWVVVQKREATTSSIYQRPGELADGLACTSVRQIHTAVL
ncbi:hypothetical protein RSAG8_07106, partial [Rhizoctonia solani AG-8 WAC10335]